MLWQGRASAEASGQELERLQSQVDSLGVLVQELRDPFGLSAGVPEADTVAVPPNDSMP